MELNRKDIEKRIEEIIADPVFDIDFIEFRALEIWSAFPMEMRHYALENDLIELQSLLGQPGKGIRAYKSLRTPEYMLRNHLLKGAGDSTKTMRRILDESVEIQRIAATYRQRHVLHAEGRRPPRSSAHRDTLC